MARDRKSYRMPKKYLYWITLALHVLSVHAERGNQQGILASTLFTFSDFACENEKLKIRCPLDTTITIQWAQYGRQVPREVKCPFIREADGFLTQDDNYIRGEEDTQCYSKSALQVVLDRCQDKRSCSLLVTTAVLAEGGDPCPGTSKYLEVAYKCRPKLFNSRVSCEGETMSLKCDKSKRIAVYSAMFGRDPQDRFQQAQMCAGPPMYDYECIAPCSLDGVMRLCHGRRKCNIDVLESTFGNPCRPETPKYLSVVYACVARRILREMKEDEAFPTTFCGDEAKDSESTLRLNDTDAAFVGQPSTIINHGVSPAPVAPGASTTDPNCTEVPIIAEVQENYVGFVADWFTMWQFMKDNHEKLTLYVVICVLSGTILLLITIIFKMWRSKQRHKRQAKLDISEPVPVTPPTILHRPEDMTLLSDASTTDRSNHGNDGVEMLSFQNNQSTFSRGMRITDSPPPPPHPATSLAGNGGFPPPPVGQHHTSTPHSHHTGGGPIPVQPPHTPMGTVRSPGSRTNSLSRGYHMQPPSRGYQVAADSSQLDGLLDELNLNDVNDNRYERNTGTLGSRSFDNYYR